MAEHTREGHEQAAATVDRRALLRRAGILAAGGAGLATAGWAPAARAAAGSPLVLGRTDNTGDIATTAATSSASTSTLQLANTAAGSPLRIVPTAASPAGSLDSGDLVNSAGSLVFTHERGIAGVVYTSVSSSQVVPVQPTRVVDTRTATGRNSIVNRSGNLDSLGRVLAGHTIEIDLSHYVFDATAVFGNLTAVTPLWAGYLTLWPEGARPGTSSVNFLPNVTTANFALSGLSAADTVLLFAHATTHVLVDVTAFVVGDASNVNAAIRPYATRPGRSEGRRPPAWYRGPRYDRYG